VDYPIAVGILTRRMSKAQRAAVLGLAVLVAVAAFLVLRPGDGEDDDAERGNPTAQQAPTTTAETPTAPETTPEAQPKEPQVTTIRVRGGRVRGGVETLEARRGDTVRFRVIADAEHEVHLHGYDVSKDVTAGEPAEFRLKADQTGIFEIELEETHTQIAELKVE
jgi:FtsP/CotA-like multicopper oxidase with cupredoxin domain